MSAPPANALTAIAGLSVGHATDLALGSGVTAIVFDAPAVAAVSVLGGAPGGRDTALLDTDMSVERVDAIVLSGGSAFGLDAAGGAQAALREAGRGHLVAGMRVPIVPQAILFDLTNGGDKAWGRFSPYRDLGYAAVRAATSPAPEGLGTVGAGTGATTATLKGGLGMASARTASGHILSALVAVNAVGTATIGDGPWFWAAPFERDGEFGARGWPAVFGPEHWALRVKGRAAPGTTIGIVVTDAALTRAQAKRLAICAHDGMARAILPAHLPQDGDTMFAASTAAPGAAAPGLPELTELCLAATIATARAIARGVYHATALAGPSALPAWRDRFGAPGGL